jgi:NAD(P)-dependent dehydrogenase (short-subunit alcohol dehydrogenase family)
VVTARDPSSLLEFQNNPDALTSELDVNNREQIAETVRLAISRFGRIDVLVNNAGYGYLAAIEEGEDSEVRAMFETNVFAVVEMTKAVLPHMRSRRTGHIVNISSMAGLVGFPGVGYYNATKFALEGLSEALAKECAPLGISVTIVEPGPFRTDWAGRSLKVSARQIADYASTAGARRSSIQGYSGSQPGDPVRAANAIISVVETSPPPLHLVLGGVAFDAAMSKVQSLRQELDSWRETSLSADYPKS